MKETKEWFGEWFDSPYYHILYRHRDEEEAKEFIDRLSEYLDFNETDKILDLACGKGRHSIYLNQKGFDVVGLDLSPQNIAFAQGFQNERLKFYVHDMREPFDKNEFDYTLNLFTSFGYFDTKAENEKVICEAAKALKKDGNFLIDFLNPYTVIHHLIPEETKVIDGIKFKIMRWLSDDGYIIKDIRFKDNGKEYEYQEKVKAIRRSEFLQYFEKADLELVNIFGNYHLAPYIPDKSERMIFLLKK